MAFLCISLSFVGLCEFPYLSARKTNNRSGLPRYNYGHDLERFRDRAVASADPVVEVNQFAESRVLKSFECCGQSKLYTVPQVLIPDGERSDLKRLVRLKPFYTPTASLSAGDVTLSQMAFDIQDTGFITASGRLANSGGPNGSLQGANITIHLRAYAGRVVGPPGTLPVNSPMIWESQSSHWISREDPKTISLTGSGRCYAAVLRQRFDGITHLEVELVAQRDR